MNPQIHWESPQAWGKPRGSEVSSQEESRCKADDNNGKQRQRHRNKKPTPLATAICRFCFRGAEHCRAYAWLPHVWHLQCSPMNGEFPWPIFYSIDLP